ncbi:MAG: MerR family transcriptional regulator [Deltaproteobacteria bacterium]|nr:MerR family transcriptional regulator [Deltaproteobacteria bacterium]
MNISEAAKKFGLTADTLRYYEKIGLLPSVGRTAGGARAYGQTECEWVEFIKFMRNAGVEVQALKEYVRLFRLGSSTSRDRKLLLVEQRARIAARLAELQGTLDRLDQKIAHYETHIADAEKSLVPGKARRPPQ